MMVAFELEGQPFMALNGGPGILTFSRAISFFVNCETQEEVDDLWEKLSEGGETQRCGWLKDKYRIYWQIVPTLLGELMNDPDPAKARRVTQAMLQMDRLDIQVKSSQVIAVRIDGISHLGFRKGFSSKNRQSRVAQGYSQVCFGRKLVRKLWRHGKPH